VNSGIRRLEHPVPLYFARGSGCRLWDEDGNESIDYQLGQGALLNGHAPGGLVQALATQAALGTHFAAQSVLEIEVAERICAMIPAVECVRFSNSATEAVSAAFRLARAQTERPLILRFEGHYHGWSDEGLVGFGSTSTSWGSESEPSRFHPSEGVIPEVLQKFVIARWGDPEHLRFLANKFRGQIAAIVFEPVMCNTSCIEPFPEMLNAIRRLCDRDGMLMVADETITGLRFGASCAQGHYGFSPDLSIFGKAIGGGVPFAVLAGRRHAFAKIETGQVIHAGTLNANPLCLAASRWCLDQILAAGDTHPQIIKKLGQSLMRGLKKLADQHGVPLRPQGPGLVFHTMMLKPGASEGPAHNHRDFTMRQDLERWHHLRLCLLEEGVRSIDRGLWFISFSHTEADIESTLARAERALVRHADAWQKRGG
jgi:glutamate-1-semialdehyde 2,1-aminomutase